MSPKAKFPWRLGCRYRRNRTKLPLCRLSHAEILQTPDQTMSKLWAKFEGSRLSVLVLCLCVVILLALLVR
jgi:hypothetical protein